MSEIGDTLRELGDLADETEELEEQLNDDSKLAWLSMQPISDEHEIATNLSKPAPVSTCLSGKSVKAPSSDLLY